MLDNKELATKALNIRKNIIKIIHEASSGHPGGALSIVEILAYLYFNELKIEINKVDDPKRDRLLLSKGHSSAALYSVLAEKGFFDEKEMLGFRNINSIFQGHPDMNKIPGVDMTSGSLGQGISVANGMAMAAKLDKENYNVYCIVGDGEIEEGQIWEAIMTSSHYNLDNLCVIVDNNNLQIDGNIKDVMNSYPIDEKFKSFGFNVINIDGHDYDQIKSAIECFKKETNKPTAIIAKTTKGKGVSFMENQCLWHGKAPNDEEYEKAMKELENN